eukprot:TRINITY_DN409_c1_g1_i3.p1 TRINITY_DN409_c1_g1~~TRINITY_DN409_c1_g1_i3.p1  ORF type:complete len:392 (+),score=101.40 TRINITY_DN409_c1_g1_i3:54-1178(+)
MGGRFKSIFDLFDRLDELDKEEREVFDRVWQLECHVAQTDAAMCRDRVVEMFGGQEEAVAMVERQRIMMIGCRFLSESSFFNEMRTRYMQMKMQKRENGRVNLVCAVSPESCDFCKLLTNTSADPFLPQGRLVRTTATTCSNIAKYAPYHSCIIFNEHNPLVPTTAQCIDDLLSIANEWVSYACQDLEGQSPVLGWNCMSKAGASMEHAHAQIMTLPMNTPWMTRMGPDHGRTIADFIAVAKFLGIATEVGDKGAIMFPMLAPTAESEMWVVGDSGGVMHEVVTFGDSVAEGIRIALNVVLEVNSSSAFNVCLAVAKTDLWPSGGVTVARIIDRGNHATISSQGFMEIFGNGIVGSSDPFAVHGKIANILDQAK